MTTANDLKPWATRPFELITHGEIHYRRGSDYDRRLALVSFDNAVEVTVSTYLTLKPIQRNGKEYKNIDVKGWLRNYHTKLDFFLEENTSRGLPEHQSKDVIAWYHDQRNEQYHGGSSGVPEQTTLDGIRQSALWVFSILFDIPNIEEILEAELENKAVGVSTIPDELAVPSTDDVQQKEWTSNESNAIAAALLLGVWHEDKDADLDIARRLVDGF